MSSPYSNLILVRKELQEARKANRSLRRWFQVCLIGWFLTIVSCMVLICTGKVEIHPDPPDFGSAYPRHFMESSR